jgi:hypothetical protein
LFAVAQWGLILAISLPGAIQMTLRYPIALQDYWLPGVALDNSYRIVIAEWFCLQLKTLFVQFGLYESCHCLTPSDYSCLLICLTIVIPFLSFFPLWENNLQSTADTTRRFSR